MGGLNGTTVERGFKPPRSSSLQAFRSLSYKLSCLAGTVKQSIIHVSIASSTVELLLVKVYSKLVTCNTSNSEWTANILHKRASFEFAG